MQWVKACVPERLLTQTELKEVRGSDQLFTSLGCKMSAYSTQTPRAPTPPTLLVIEANMDESHVDEGMGNFFQVVSQHALDCPTNAHGVVLKM